MIARIARMAPLSLGLLALSSSVSTVRAQGNTFNPYGNSGYADYREFGNPAYANNPALPGQALLNSEPSITRPRANSYQQYTQELDGSDSRGSSAGLPYYQAYQRLNSQYNRVYRPNDTDADRKFEDRLRQRNRLYAESLAEKDPVKKARLLREINQSSLDRPSAANRAKPSAAKTDAMKRATPSTTARSPAPAPSATSPRRTPAPPTGEATRSPATSRTPAPARSGSTDVLRSRPSTEFAPPDPSSIPIPAPR